ncbi:MAG: hypothetical protein WDN03_08780 [Rhizomicrobium sp.]
MPSGIAKAIAIGAAILALTAPAAPGHTSVVTGAFAYNELGQVATSTDANGNVTRFAYDAAGRTIAVRDPLYNVTSYAYDGDGRRIAVSNLAIQPGPLSQASYTANGLPHVLTDAAGHGVTLGYDGLDRPAATTYPDASAQTLSYDADGNVVTRLTRAGDTLSYAYDTRNLLCSKAVAAVATPCTATSSANPTVWYAHDLDGRSLGARDNGAVLAAVGAQASYAMAARYDALNRPTNVAWSPVQAQAPPPASSVTFGHGYDAGNRRITQTATDTGWWAVPASASSTAYTANALNQYSAVDAVAPAYDGNGNLTFDGSFAYCYDAESRLTAVLSAGTCASPTTTVATYAYDAQGRRKSRTVGGVTTVTVADADDREVLEYDGSSGAVTAWYAYGHRRQRRRRPHGRRRRHAPDPGARHPGLDRRQPRFGDRRHDPLGLPPLWRETRASPPTASPTPPSATTPRPAAAPPSPPASITTAPASTPPPSAASSSPTPPPAPPTSTPMSETTRSTRPIRVGCSRRADRTRSTQTRPPAPGAISTSTRASARTRSSRPSTRSRWWRAARRTASQGSPATISETSSARQPTISNPPGASPSERRLSLRVAWRRGAERAGLFAAESIESGLSFSQTTASPWFHPEGNFAGQTISDLASQLRAGALLPENVPVQVLGNGLIVNTRSSLALMQAGIPQSEWSLIDMTGNAQVEADIAARLAHNGLVPQELPLFGLLVQAVTPAHYSERGPSRDPDHRHD